MPCRPDITGKTIHLWHGHAGHNRPLKTGTGGRRGGGEAAGKLDRVCESVQIDQSESTTHSAQNGRKNADSRWPINASVPFNI